MSEVIAVSTSAVEIVRNWSTAERKQALAELVGDLVRDDKEPVVVENVGLVWPFNGEVRVVQFDDATPFAQEMRHRLETAHDADIIAEFDLEIDGEEQLPES